MTGRLTPAAAAELLGVTVERLFELAGEAQIPGAVLDASGWHFSRRALENWLTRRAGRRGGRGALPGGP